MSSVSHIHQDLLDAAISKTIGPSNHRPKTSEPSSQNKPCLLLSGLNLGISSE